MQSEFEELDVKLAIISTDDLDSHTQWKLLMEYILLESGNSITIDFPFIEDDMEEIKRVVVALQTSEQEQVIIPANWNLGDDVLMKYHPYSESELAYNPDQKNQYYKVGVNLWFKKREKNISLSALK